MMAVILLFLFLGGLLYLYSESLGAVMENGKYMLNGHEVNGDKLFPYLALNHMPHVVSVIFIIALISALFPSADGAITALTSSFCIDILGMQRRENWPEADKKKTRQRVHLVVAFIFLFFVMVFHWVNNPSMIGVILKVAAYTYGPLLGLFGFGMFTKRTVMDKWVPLVCITAPVLCYLLDSFQKNLFGDFQIGLELLIINGLLTYAGLLIISKKAN